MTAPRKRNGNLRKPRRTQEERRAETSGRLLKATIDLLLQKGYSQFRIADAAARAKVSRGGQTHHFATKNDLIEAAIDQLFTSEVGNAQVVAANTEDADVVRHAALHADEFFSSKLFRVSLNMLVSVGEHEHLADGVRAISARSRAPMEEAWISRVVQLGTDHEQAEEVLGLLWSVQRGTMVDDFIGGDPAGADDDELEFVIDLLCEYLSDRDLPG